MLARELCEGRTSILPKRQLSNQEVDNLKQVIVDIACPYDIYRLVLAKLENNMNKIDLLILRALFGHGVLLHCLGRRWSEYGLTLHHIRLLIIGRCQLWTSS